MNKEQQDKTDALVNDWIAEYKIKHKQSPSGRDQTAYRHRIELQYLSLSELITKMIKIGDPQALDAARGSKDEFERIAAEIDRREKLYTNNAEA
jgi:hypothetical protein